MCVRNGKKRRLLDARSIDRSMQIIIINEMEETRRESFNLSEEEEEVNT